MTSAILFVLLSILLAGVLYQLAGAAGDRRRFPPAGKLIDIDGGRLHFHVMGQGTPTVVFEAGIGATSLSWALVQPEVAKFTRTVSYDRGWLGWSDATQKPRSIRQLIAELRTGLDRVGIAGPRILVAHSYGALVALAYAARYPAEIAGLVLVDPVAVSEWSEPTDQHRRMLRRGVLLSRVGRSLATLGVVRFTLNRLSGGSRTLPKLIARASSGRSGGAFTERMVGEIRKLPKESWPKIQSHWCDPKCFEGMARYLEALPENAAEVAKMVLPPEIPLVVLSAENSSPAQRADHEKLASHGSLEIVEDSGHWIQLDRPDAIIRAIRSGVLPNPERQ